MIATDSAKTDITAVFHTRGITKVYQMGEVQVHALRGIDLDLYQGEFIVMLEALAKVNRELGTTTMVITHNVAIANMADRVIRLSDGKVKIGVREQFFLI